MIYLWLCLSLMAMVTEPAKPVVQARRLNYFKDSVVDGLETEYNEYAQSWRLLGLYEDCQTSAPDQRRLQEGGDQNNQNQAQCGRYLLWAAYVDVDYEGGGLTEYKIFDKSKKKYDATACKEGDSSRCVKMDCHSSGTRYKPLGYFRQDSPTDFIQLLAKYQGSCSWDEDQYNTIVGAGWLPKGCTATGDNDLYYDFKPVSGGGIDIGVYVDNQCSIENTDPIDMDDLISEKYGQEVDVSKQLQIINNALDTFKVCQPCRTYDLSVEVNESDEQKDEANDQDAANNNNNNNNNEDPNHNMFICTDAAGNNGINMCEAIAQNSEISTASLSEIYLASTKGTIQRTFGADPSATWWDTWGFLLLSYLVFMTGITSFCCVAVKRKKVTIPSNREPLVRS